MKASGKIEKNLEIGGVTIGPGLLRWRAPDDFWVKNQKIIGAKNDTRFVGIPINAFSPPCSSLREKQQKRLSDRAVHEIYRRVLVSLDAQSADEIADRLTTLIPYDGSQSVLGKIPLIDLRLETSPPVQIDGLGGEMLLRSLAEFQPAQWLPAASLVARRDQAHYGAAGETSILDFSYLFETAPSPDKGAILRGKIELPEPLRVSFLFKPDWWGRVQVDGVTVIDMSDRTSGGAYGTATLDLDAGSHVLRAEVVSGTAGFEALLLAREGEIGDSQEVQSLLVRSIPESRLLPYNPAENALYRSAKQDDQDPYLYKT